MACKFAIIVLILLSVHGGEPSRTTPQRRDANRIPDYTARHARAPFVDSLAPNTRLARDRATAVETGGQNDIIDAVVAANLWCFHCAIEVVELSEDSGDLLTILTWDHAPEAIVAASLVVKNILTPSCRPSSFRAPDTIHLEGESGIAMVKPRALID